MNFASAGPLTLAIIAATTVVSLLAFTRPQLIADMLLDVFAVRQNKEYYRLLTAGVLHADIGHLFFNMLSFWFFANPIELYYGSPVVAVVFIVGILGGNVLALLLHRNEPHYRALGASGGVCGIIFACIFLLPGSSVYMYFIPIPIPAWLYAILFIAFSAYGARSKRDNVGHDAHIGGALLGLLAAAAMYPRIITSSPLLFAAVMGGGLCVLVYLHRLSQGER